jgi:hypothetical protein
MKEANERVHSSDVIFPGLFLFSSPRTFGLFKSRDFLVPGPSGSLGPGTISPGTSDLLSQDFPGRPGTFISILLQFLEVRCYVLDFCDIGQKFYLVLTEEESRFYNNGLSTAFSKRII